MKKFEVQWRFKGSWLRPQVCWVLAQDKQHAEDQIWLHHVPASRLRAQIEIVEIKEMIG